MRVWFGLVKKRQLINLRVVFSVRVCMCVFVCLFINRAALGRVCIKLVVVMGITWILDFLSWIHTTLDGNNRHAFWIVPDLINALHGVFIFIVVGCQPQVNRNKQNYLYRCIFIFR